MSKRTDSPGLGSIRSGALTALSLLFVTGIAAVIGVVVAREFGRTEETDGFLSAYGVFVVILIAAQAIRVAVLPQLARARTEQRLAGEIAGYALALALFAAPLLVVAELATRPLADLLTSESVTAEETATLALRWIIPAAIAHLFAALAASGLAALDDYGTAAVGYAAGSVAGLALILVRVDSDGIVAVAWGMALNAAIATAVPAVALMIRAGRARMPRTAVRPRQLLLGGRLSAFAVSAALPLTQQLLYVLCLPLAARQGTGAVTSFVYAYLAASSLVVVTAGSVGLVTSVPLTRVGLGTTGATRHVAATSWLVLALVGGAAGVVAVAGADLVEAVLGAAYGGDVASDLRTTIVLLSPWMVAAVGVTLAFPLTFVVSRTRRLPVIAVSALVLLLPIAWLGARLAGIDGLALALGLVTMVMLLGLVRELEALEAASALAIAASLVAGLAVVAYGPLALVVGSIAAAVGGSAVYLGLLALLRPRGLVSSWRYLRALA